MLDRHVVQSRIINLMADKLEVQVPSVETDLFDDGSLDSLSYVRLVVEMQREFDIQISLAQVDVDHFRTVEQMSDLLMQIESELATA